MKALIATILFILPLQIFGMSKFQSLWDSWKGESDKRPVLAVLFTQSSKTREEEYENLADVATFAMEQFANQSGKAAELRIVGVDDGDNPEIARKNLERLMAKEDVKAVIGPIYSRVAMGLRDFIEQKQIPLISIFATHNDLTKDSKYIFRICASNMSLVTTVADHLMPLIKQNKLHVISFKDVTDTYSIDLSDNFKSVMEKRKVPVQEVIFRGLTGLENLRDLNAKVWNPSKKDVLFLPNRDIVAGKILAALESEPYLVAAVDTVNFLPLMDRIKPHETHIRILTAFQWLPGKTPFSAATEVTFERAFKRPMTITSALTFDATLAMASAYRRSIERNVAIRDALLDGTTLTGVTGAIILGTSGERKSVEKFFKEELIR